MAAQAREGNHYYCVSMWLYSEEDRATKATWELIADCEPIERETFTRVLPFDDVQCQQAFDEMATPWIREKEAEGWVYGEYWVG